MRFRRICDRSPETSVSGDWLFARARYGYHRVSVTDTSSIPLTIGISRGSHDLKAAYAVDVGAADGCADDAVSIDKPTRSTHFNASSPKRVIEACGPTDECQDDGHASSRNRAGAI